MSYNKDLSEGSIIPSLFLPIQQQISISHKSMNGSSVLKFMHNSPFFPNYILHSPLNDTDIFSALTSIRENVINVVVDTLYLGQKIC